MPPGEVYSYTEGGNGELGFYLVSDGTGRPVEVPRAPALLRHRPRCCRRCCQACFIADVVPTFGMINMIGGECDR